MSQWYLLRNNQPLGPYEEKQVREWVKSGQIGPADQLCPVGSNAWQPLGEFVEFAADAPASVPPGAAPGSAPPTSAYPPAYQPAAATPAGAGLGAWITKGWEMVTSDVGAFIGAALLVGLLSLVSLFICAPPLAVGFYRMLLRKHDGGAVRAGDVFEGFGYFGSAWGLALIIGGLSLVFVLPLAIIVGVVQSQGGKEAAQALNLVVQGFSNLLTLAVGTITLFAMPMIADGRGGALEAFSESWNTVKSDFWMCLVAYLVFQIIASAGLVLCGVGVLFTGPLSSACIVATYRSRFPASPVRY